jgi:ribonuclease E
VTPPAAAEAIVLPDAPESVTPPAAPVTEVVPALAAAVQAAAPVEALPPETASGFGEPQRRPEHAEPVQAPAPEPETAPAAPPHAAAEQHAAQAEARAILEKLKLDWSADLVQIETDPQKVRPPEVEEEPAPRPRRVRRPPPPVSDEPLVQIETRRRDSGSESAPVQM